MTDIIKIIINLKASDVCKCNLNNLKNIYYVTHKQTYLFFFCIKTSSRQNRVFGGCRHHWKCLVAFLSLLGFPLSIFLCLKALLIIAVDRWKTLEELRAREEEEDILTKQVMMIIWGGGNNPRKNLTSFPEMTSLLYFLQHDDFIFIMK